MIAIADKSRMERRSIAKEKLGRESGTGITPFGAPLSSPSILGGRSVAVLSISVTQAVLHLATVGGALTASGVVRQTAAVFL
jgi:hypothetical protein